MQVGARSVAPRKMTRRGMIGSGLGLLALSACGNGIGNSNAQQIDARVDATRNFLLQRYPGTGDLMNKAVGVLYMPLMTEAGFMVGGAYGQGALRINNVTVDYYSAASASWGFQIGAQQYGHALFFMTEQSLAEFRASPGWVAGADAKYAVSDQAGSLGIDTTTSLAPVIALVFGQTGLIAGASVAGTKYTRIIP